MTTPVTQAPKHDFSRNSRGYKREVLADLERCDQCRHFYGNHKHYVWNTRCGIDGCDCGAIIQRPCGCEHANNRPEWLLTRCAAHHGKPVYD